MEMRAGIKLVCDSDVLTEHAKMYTFAFGGFMDSATVPTSEANSMLLPTNFKLEASTTAAALAGIGVGGNTIYCPKVDTDYLDATIPLTVRLGGAVYTGEVNTASMGIGKEIILMKG